jgi:hypothetical protein
MHTRTVTPSRRRSRGGSSVLWKGRFHLEWVIGGKVYHDIADNQLYDAGEQQLLEVYFRAAAAPADFKIGLLKTAYAIDETHTMVNVGAQELTNAADGGYSARQTLTRDNTGWPTSALNGGDWQITSAQVSWTATGAWTDTAGYLFLMTGGNTTPANTTGTILAVAALSPTRQLQAANDILRVTYALKLQ